MSIPVLICDDSTLARKRLARSLPDALAGDVRFARHGRDALSQLREKSTQLLFLDLTMPEMDGYETLAAIRADGIQVRVIVVSGDIQPTAHQRVMDLGAIAFIKKPIAADTLQQVLQGLELTAAAGPTATGRAAIAGEVIRRRDVYQEVASVAMGRAADSLARLLGVHVQLPIPNVNIFEVSELHMALHSVGTGESTSGVCQGFIGEGIAGEALLILTDSSVRSLARLMRYQGEVNADTERELLLDLSNILIGAVEEGPDQDIGQIQSGNCCWICPIS